MNRKARKAAQRYLARWGGCAPRHVSAVASAVLAAATALDTSLVFAWEQTTFSPWSEGEFEESVAMLGSARRPSSPAAWPRPGDVERYGEVYAYLPYAHACGYEPARVRGRAPTR